MLKPQLLASVGAAIATLFLAGCATTFTGDAHVPGGRSGCVDMCQAQGMDVAGMVFMGEYSSACVCEVASGDSAAVSSSAVAAAGGSAAGVVLQMRAAQQQQAARH
jgi:hypothetical protein